MYLGLLHTIHTATLLKGLCLLLTLDSDQLVFSRRQLENQVEEQEVRRCGSVSEVRELASKKPGLKESLIDSMSPVKVTLTNIANRLEWKGSHGQL